MAEWVVALCVFVGLMSAWPEPLGLKPMVRGWRVVGVGGVVVVGVIVPSYGGLVVVGGAAGAATLWRIRRRRRWARVRETSRAVEAACRDLADDMRMGRAPREAISDAAKRWPPLRSVAIAAELDHEVPQAFVDLGELPGAEGLRAVAAAWSVSQQVGSGLAESLHQVARLLAARERRARLVDAELAAARSTALAVCCLPLFVLGLGSGLGANPWSFFLTTAGTAVLAVGVALMCGGWWWLDRLTERALA